MKVQTNDLIDFEKVAVQVFAEMNERGQKMEKEEFKNRLRIKLKTVPSTQDTKTLNLVGYISDRLVENYAVRVGGKMEKLKPCIC